MLYPGTSLARTNTCNSSVVSLYAAHLRASRKIAHSLKSSHITNHPDQHMDIRQNILSIWQTIFMDKNVSFTSGCLPLTKL